MLFQDFCSRKRAVLCTQGTDAPESCWEGEQWIFKSACFSQLPPFITWWLRLPKAKEDGFSSPSGLRNQTLDLYPSVWPAPSIFLCTLPPPEFISGVPLKTSVRKPCAFSFLLVSRGSPRSCCWPCSYSLDLACNVATTRLLWEGPITARMGRTAEAEDSLELSGTHACLFPWGHHKALDNMQRQTARSSCRILVQRPQRDGSVGEVLAVHAWGPDFDPCPQSLGKEAGHSHICLLIPGRKKQGDPWACWLAILAKQLSARFSKRYTL